MLNEIITSVVSALAVAMAGQLLRLLGYWMGLRAWNQHERRKLESGEGPPDKLQPPPPPPPLIGRISIAVLFLGATLGVLLYCKLAQERQRAIELARPAPPPPAPAPRELPMMLAERCETSSNCPRGCTCSNGQCHCAARAPERKPPADKKKKGKGGTGSTPSGEVPHSGLASKLPAMAGDPNPGFLSAAPPGFM